MEKLFIKTGARREIVDITDRINDSLRGLSASDGLCHLFLLHTTAAITTADLDPGTDLDILDAFEALVPKLKYRHPHDPRHTWEHIMHAMVGPSLLVPVRAGKLVLGTWQRVVLVELGGPRSRELIVSCVKIETVG